MFLSMRESFVRHDDIKDSCTCIVVRNNEVAPYVSDRMCEQNDKKYARGVRRGLLHLIVYSRFMHRWNHLKQDRCERKHSYGHAPAKDTIY